MSKPIFRSGSLLGVRTTAFLLLALLLILVDHYNSAFHRFRSYVAIVVSPIQYVVSGPIHLVSWLVDDMASQESLIVLNKNLNVEITLLKAQLQKQIAIEKENTELRQLLLSSNNAPEKMAAAQLLAVAPDPFVHQVVIDKGSSDDVYIGQPVLDGYGVMGQVVQVGPFSSRVLLLTDPSSEIPVQIARNGVRAIAEGDPSNGELILKHVTATTDIQTGDDVITSALGGRYPFGYPVGKVTQVTTDSGDQFADVSIEPAAHLDRSRLVLLIWPNKLKISPEIKAGLNSKSVPIKTPATGGQS